jgi:hypothetical protein
MDSTGLNHDHSLGALLQEQQKSKQPASTSWLVSSLCRSYQNPTQRVGLSRQRAISFLAAFTEFFAAQEKFDSAIDCTTWKQNEFKRFTFHFGRNDHGYSEQVVGKQGG